MFDFSLPMHPTQHLLRALQSTDMAAAAAAVVVDKLNMNIKKTMSNSTVCVFATFGYRMIRPSLTQTLWAFYRVRVQTREYYAHQQT